MLGRVVAQPRHLVRTTVTAVRGAWEGINANRTGYTVNLAWLREPTVQLTHTVAAARICIL